jgi:DNA (cytosine-5)-methyltransferase 1
MSLRILELFSGLGGWRYALQGMGEVIAAYDISPTANATYMLNHGDRPIARELASIAPATMAAHQADLWAMSPPCQPFCRMGNRHGLEDRRSKAFLNLIDILPLAPPQHLIMENVSGFLGSNAHELIEGTLKKLGFHTHTCELCPTQFGIPNQRPRLYLLASQRPLKTAIAPQIPPVSIAIYLDSEEDPSLYLDPQVLAKHKPGLDLVRPDEHRTACFIGGYGQRFVGSGSFLKTDHGIRRFSTAEVARFMGLPPTFRFPEEISIEQRYKLLGNGLNIPVASWVARQLSV